MAVGSFPTKFFLIVYSVLHIGSSLPNRAVPGLSYLPPSPGNAIKENTPVQDSYAGDLPQAGSPFGLPSPSVADPPYQNEEESCLRICPFNYDPVCGSDDVTYTNECTFSVAACKDFNLSLKGLGSCASIPIGTPAFSAPEAPLLPEVPFLDNTPGSGVIPFPPSFGTLGDTGGDPSVFESFAPSPSEGCPEACTKIYDPVCGTDGVTYNNKCLFEIALCKGSSSGLTLNIAFGGPCDSSLSAGDSGIIDAVDVRGSGTPTNICKEECTKIFEPLCGTDSITYNNLCLLQLASCNNVNAGSYAIDVDYEGSCVTRDAAVFVSALQSGPAEGVAFGVPQDGSPLSSCPEACTKIFSPVCGSDDQTYNNECLLNVESCKGRSAGLDAVFKVFDGPCVAVLPRGPVCDESCDKTFIPVCGSDGETYNNVCLLNLADCLNAFVSISYVREGPCESSAPPRLSSDPRPDISTAPRPASEIADTHGSAGHDVLSHSQIQEYLPPV